MADEKKLKSGFTTGAAAAAAVKGALLSIIEKNAPEKIVIKLLTGDEIAIPIHSIERVGEDKAFCTVIKDAGDDPDVTHKAEIGAAVKIFPHKADIEPLVITGGKGVGVVTKPGLEVPPGQPAINPGPRRMIKEAVASVEREHGFQGRIEIEIFVPNGEELAKKTLNARLGIIGGISILGTTGVVRPMSHDAYRATIRSAVSVADACGIKTAVFTTGRRSERFAQNVFCSYPEEAFIQIGDFFGFSLKCALESRLSAIILAVFFGKALKMADGLYHTHAANSRLSFDNLGRWTKEITGDQALKKSILTSNTARDAYYKLIPNARNVIDHVGETMIVSASRIMESETNMHPGIDLKMKALPRIRAVIFDFDGDVFFDSESNR